MKFLFTFLLAILAFTSFANTDSLMTILEKELQREYEQLSKSPNPPYYMAFRVTETHNFYAVGNLGNIESQNQTRQRRFTPEVRVGSFMLDNSRELQGGFSSPYTYSSLSAYLPLNNNDLSIQQTIWQMTDKSYKNAVNRYEKIEANKHVNVEKEDKSSDFTPLLNKEHYVENIMPFRYNSDFLEKKVKRYSAILKNNKAIINGKATIVYKIERKYFLSSEGTKVAYNLPYTYLSISGSVKADDGMDMSLYKSYFAYHPDSLPSDNVIEKDILQLSDNLSALLSAPIVDAYSGPVILSPAASGVFFHEIFGHRIEGLRLKSENDGQTFKKKVGQQILPQHLTVKSLPRLKKFKTFDLNGYYPYDEEGVASQDVTVVRNGMLENFLMTRTPIDGFEKSNGHARANDGLLPVARQSNLLIETNAPKSKEELRKLLIEEIVKQEKDYGYYFEEVQGGFTATNRYMPNSFNVTPTLVYRIYADGRPDELVRGVDLVGTPLAMFSQIAQAGDEVSIFTGTCGAESGGIPVTAISPSLLVNRIELQKKPKSSTLKPLLSRPE